MRLAVKGLVVRKGIFQFRRAVPPDLRDCVGKLEWKQSLGLTLDREAEALEKARKLWRSTDQQIDALRRKRAAGQSEFELIKAAERWAQDLELLAGQPGSINEVIEVGSVREALDSQRELMIAAIVGEAEQAFGLDDHGRPQRFTSEQKARLAVLRHGKAPRPEMRLSDARDSYFSNQLEGKPDNAAEAGVKQLIEKMGDVRLSEISRLAVEEWVAWLYHTRGQSQSTIRRRLSTTKAMFNFVNRRHDLGLANPFENQSPPKAAKAPIDRVPFHTSHLKAIDAHLAQETTNRTTARLLTLLKLTGCRPLEIGGLSRGEVYLQASISQIRLQPTEGRSLKTRTSARPIPLLPQAREALEDALKGADSAYVFPPSCRDSSKLSQRLNKAIKSAGVPTSPRLVAYSFRHGMAEALKAAEVPIEVRRSLLGHEEPGASGGYGVEHRPPQRLLKALEVAVPHLGAIDTAVYARGELSEVE